MTKNQTYRADNENLYFIYSIVWIFLAWIAVSSALSLALANVNVSTNGYHAINFATIVVMIFIGSFFSLRFAKAVSECPQVLNKQRFKLIAICFLLQTTLFLISKAVNEANVILGTVATANLLIFALLLGSWLVTPLTRPAELVVVAVVMSIADVFSVSSGPTAIIAEEIAKYYSAGMKGSVPLGDFLLLKMPVAGEFVVAPVFGVADWIVVVFFIFASLRFGIRDNVIGRSLCESRGAVGVNLYLPISVVGLLLALVVARVTGGFVPALPFIAVCFTLFMLSKYKSARNLTRSDWGILIIFSVILTSLTILRKMGVF